MKLSRKPTLKITFAGVFLVCFDENNRQFEAGVIRLNDHCFKIKVSRNSGQGKKEYAVLPDDVLQGDILFEVPGRGQSVEAFLGNDDRLPDEDFRWIVDLESREFHGQLSDQPLPFKRDVNIQRVIVRQGQFYTAARQQVVIEPPQILNADKYLAPVTRVIGCNINLGDGEKGILSFGNQRMEFPAIVGTTYEIAIENLCEPVEASHAGDFRRLYDVLDVTPKYQFNALPDIDDNANEILPCIPANSEVIQPWGNPAARRMVTATTTPRQLLTPHELRLLKLLAEGQPPRRTA